MIEQLKTIRDNLGKFAAGYIDAGNQIVAALTQLEAMVWEQKPVAWQRRMKPVWGDRDYLWSPWEECSEGTAEDCWKTPLLHEWAYEARALYTAVPVDQRPRAKEIGEADLDPDEGDPVTLWTEIWRLREAVKGPDGYATWQDAATAERIRRVRAESKQAEEAKAAPTHDDTDLIKQMLEALRSCSGVSHWPALIPTINAARKRLEAPQPSEAVPPGYVLVPVEPTEAMLLRGAPENSPYGINYAEACYRAMIAAAIAQQKGGV